MSSSPDEQRGRRIIVGVGPTSSKKAFDHEETALPNPHSNPGDIRFGNATRTHHDSGGAAQRRVPLVGTASGVTSGGAAEQSQRDGATVAVPTSRSLTQSDAPFVIEDNDDEATASPTKSSTDVPRFSLAAAMVEQKRSAASEMLQREEQRRAELKIGKAGASSIADYEGRCATIDRIIERLRDEDDGGDERPDVGQADILAVDDDVSFSLLERAISVYAHVPATFSKMKSALKWRAVFKLGKLVEVDGADINLSAVDHPAVRDRWLAAIDRVMERVTAIEGLNLKRLRALSKSSKKRSESKRIMLRYLPVDWREAFMAENDKSPTYRIPGLLMRHLGLRPMELQTGVVARLEGEHLRVTMQGAKVTETAGQPLRSVILRASLMPPAFIEELRAGEMRVSAKRDAMRTHFSRLSERLYGNRSRRSKKLIVSGYCFRHAVATELFLEGWEPLEVAEVLGESAEETVAWYGDRPRRSTRPLKPQAIIRGASEVSRPVRPRSKDWVRAKQAASKPRIPRP